MNYNLSEDIGNVTGLSGNTLTNIVDKAILCVCHDVYQSMLEKDDCCVINIGLGTLYIKRTEEEVKYKFIPNNQLNNNIIDTITNKRSPLTQTVENTIVERINSTYKTLF